MTINPRNKRESEEHPVGLGVKTQCPTCGYHDCYPIFSVNKCRGACKQSYGAIPLDKEEGIRVAKNILARAQNLPSRRGK